MALKGLDMKACDIDYERLEKLRKKAGKTKTAIAAELGISLSHVSEFERGKKGIGLALLRQLVALYDYELELTIVQRSGRSELRHRLL